MWMLLTGLTGCVVVDKVDPWSGPPADDTDVEPEVTDSDPPIDTDPVETAIVDTAAEPVDTAVDFTRHVEIELTADDAWELWFDGSPAPPPSGSDVWRAADVVSAELPGRRHVIAVHAWDQQRVIAGFMAIVRVSGEPYARTGDTRWRIAPDAPPPDWIQRRFDDSTWAPAPACDPGEAAVWGGNPTDLVALGAEWVWHLPCTGLGEAWFRLEIE